MLTDEGLSGDLCVGEGELMSEAGSGMAKAGDDIGFDDISDDELDDLIEGAEDEQDEQPAAKTIGIWYYLSSGTVVVITVFTLWL